jgi:hypothetical protein
VLLTYWCWAFLNPTLDSIEQGFSVGMLSDFELRVSQDFLVAIIKKKEEKLILVLYLN